jgi:hypothetical protein
MHLILVGIFPTLILQMDEVKISTLTVGCQRHFGTLHESLSTAKDGNFLHELPRVAIEDELGRFRIWANNIGASNRGTSSLDYRLRDAKFISESVKTLLNSLNKILLADVTTVRTVFC